jgi:TM2 domain-containing membrane protein YozV
MTKIKLKWEFALVMSLLFGWMGVDRFMMGQVGWGILKLVTFGGVFVWWIVDMILVATKHEFENVEWV